MASDTALADPEDDGFGKPPGQWLPDAQLLPALLAGSTSVTYAQMTRGDRAWAIAGLRRAGVTAEAIAEQLLCSLRQVRAVAAEPAAIMARFYMDEADTFEDTLRMYQGDVARLDRERAEAEATAARYQAQLRNMLDSALIGDLGATFPKCGHPKTWGNTYKAPKTGKLSCRMCHADAQAEYWARKKAAEATPEGDTGGHGEVITGHQSITVQGA